MAELSVAELMGKMPKAFNPEKAKGVDTILQLKFTGKEAGDWFAVIKDGTVKVEQGVHPNPKMTLSADSDDYIALFTGKMDPMQAFMQGKLKLQGDLNQAMKMTQYFKMR
jgi:putative sterol carrier protein